jgi:hemerythrin
MTRRQQTSVSDQARSHPPLEPRRQAAVSMQASAGFPGVHPLAILIQFNILSVLTIFGEHAMNPPPAAGLHWNDGMLLGCEFMDAEHEELVTLITALQQVSDAEVPAAFDALAAHARSHFQSEEAWMHRTDFPAQTCHSAEHDAVLQSIRGVHERVHAGDLAVARRVADALADWFPGHAEYLDAALAHWICNQQHGGKPVVLRRHIPTVDHPPAADRRIGHFTSGRV